MSNNKIYTFCQMSVTNLTFLLKNCLNYLTGVYRFIKLIWTKPSANMGICNCMYINVTNSCNSEVRYTFDKLILRLTEYTSCEVGNPSKVVPTIKTTCYEE